MLALVLGAEMTWANHVTTFEISLPGGLVVLHRPDSRYPVVRVVLAVRGATADAPAGKRSLPHLVEHLAFRTTLDGTPADVALRSAGCWFNAETSLDHTTYQMECPKDAAGLATRFALALANHDLRGLDDAAVGVESRVVLNELTQSDDRGSVYADAIGRIVFSGNHPYHVPDGGADSVLSLTLGDVLGFAAAHYLPENSVLALGGDLDRRELATLLAENAGDGVAHPRQRRGETQQWPGAAVRWLGVDDAPILWFRDPDHPEQPLGPGASNRELNRADPEPPIPAPGVHELRTSGGWPTVVVAWYLPPADRDRWWAVATAAEFAMADLEPVLDHRTDVLSWWCDPAPGERGSMLVCAAVLEEEEHQQEVGEKIARAFEAPYTLVRQQRLEQLYSDSSRRDGDLWEVDRDGLPALVTLAHYRLHTGLFDIVGTRKVTVDGGAGLVNWQATFGTWLHANQATTLFYIPEGREAQAGSGRTVALAAAEPKVAWPAPDMGITSGRTAIQTVLPNGLTTVRLPAPGIPVSAWRLVVPAVPGGENLAAFLNDALETPPKLDGNELRYRCRVNSSSVGAVVAVTQLGTWDPRHVLRSIWGTVQGLRTGNLDAAFRRQVLRTVYAGRSPYTWRDRIWSAKLRRAAQWQDLHELRGLLDEKGGPERYLRAQFRPERSVLLVVGRPDEEAEKRIGEEMGDWSTGDPEPLADASMAPEVTPAQEVLVLDGVRRGRTVSASWMCPTNPASGKTNSLVSRLVAEVADARLYQAARATTGLTYTPLAWASQPSGAASALHLSMDTELGREVDALTVLRRVARELGTRAATPAEIRAASRRVLARELLASASTAGLADHLARALAEAGSLSEVQARRAALSDFAPADILSMTRLCEEHGTGALIGPEADIKASLLNAGIEARVVDWRADHLKLVAKWLPAKSQREQQWLEHARN